MPLETCPINEATLAEYALGPGRSRLDEAATQKVIAHLAVCRACQQAYAAYMEDAQAPRNFRHSDGRLAEDWIQDSSRNVKTRLNAYLAAGARDQARREVERRWRRRVPTMVAVSVIAGAIITFGAYKRLMPATISNVNGNSITLASLPLPPVEYVLEPAGPAAVAVADIAPATAELKRAVDAAPPEQALALLEQQRATLTRASAAEADAWQPRLTAMHEQIALRAAHGPAEGAAWLALARAYWDGGYPHESLDAFQRHADFLGEQARREAKGESPAAAAQQTKAAAYHDEALRYYEARDYVAALRLCEQLLGKYPTSVKAYEGQIIAARCHIANRQPSGAVACYRRIVEHCPDERFARAAAEMALKFLAEAGRGDEAIMQCQELRERFADDEFRAFTLFTEGRLLKDKGSDHFPEAIVLLREAGRIRPDTPQARQAGEWVKELQDKMFRQLLPDVPAGQG